jgi:mono/diheme cytochrome c family protein
MKSISCLFCAAFGLFVLETALMSQTKKPAAPVQAAVPQATMDRGKKVYLEQCLACHQADALGVQNMNPPLVKTKQILGDKVALVKIVLNGMTGIEIEGEDYHGVMAAHSDLTDLQISDVLTYIRNSFGNKARAISVAEVKAIRAKNAPPVKP